MFKNDITSRILHCERSELLIHFSRTKVNKKAKNSKFGEFLKTQSLRSNSVTREVNLNRTKIDGKMLIWKNSNATFWVSFKHCVRYKIIPKLFGHTVLASIFALLENLKRKWWQFFAISFFPFRLLFLSFSPDCMIEVVLSISLSHQRGRLIVVVLNKAKILYRTSKKLHFFFPYTKLLLIKFYRRLMMTNSRTLHFTVD